MAQGAHFIGGKKKIVSLVLWKKLEFITILRCNRCVGRVGEGRSTCRWFTQDLW